MKHEQLAQVSNIIKCNKGISVPFYGFIMLVAIAIGMLSFEFARQIIIINGVMDNVREAITCCATSNMYESFSAIRDSEPGAYICDGERYSEISDTTTFYSYLAIYYNIDSDGNTFTQYRGDDIYLRIKDIEIYVDNSMGTYLIKYKIDISSQFWKKELYSHNIAQEVKYINKF